MTNKTLFEKYAQTHSYKRKQAILKKIRVRENIKSCVILGLAAVGFVALCYFGWSWLTTVL